MIISLLVCGFWKLPNGLPLVSNCSAAISAACHPDPNTHFEPGLEEEPLMWGASDELYTHSVGHGTFRANNVKHLAVGKLYS